MKKQIDRFRRFLLRLTVFPFVFAIIFIRYNIFCVGLALRFLSNGGEWISYEVNDKQTVKDIFEELKNQRK